MYGGDRHGELSLGFAEARIGHSTYNLDAQFPPPKNTPMTGRSHQKSEETAWITVRLLDVIHHPVDSEATLDVLLDFVSKKNYLVIVRSLKKEDVVKLVNVMDEVRRVSFRALSVPP